MRLAVLGEKLPYTLSPVIHGKIMESIGRAGEYTVAEKTPEELGEFIQTARKGEYLGFNVTIPYKTCIMKFLDELSPEARRIGAVNTVHIREGRLIGYNTDYFGFGYMLKKAGINVQGKKACVMGAGGAAKAVAVYLMDAGAEVVVVSRNTEKAKAVFKAFNVSGYESMEGELLVNTTPVGTSPDTERSPAGKDTVARFLSVAELIYNPKKTLLLRYAEELNLPYAGGLYMLVAQAVKAQEIWQGIEIQETLIDRIAEEL